MNELRCGSPVAKFERGVELARLVPLPRVLLGGCDPARRLVLIGLIDRAVRNERDRARGLHWAEHPARRLALVRALGHEIAALRLDAWRAELAAARHAAPGPTLTS